MNKKDNTENQNDQIPPVGKGYDEAENKARPSATEAPGTPDSSAPGAHPAIGGPRRLMGRKQKEPQSVSQHSAVGNPMQRGEVRARQGVRPSVRLGDNKAKRQATGCNTTLAVRNPMETGEVRAHQRGRHSVRLGDNKAKRQATGSNAAESFFSITPQTKAGLHNTDYRVISSIDHSQYGPLSPAGHGANPKTKPGLHNRDHRVMGSSAALEGSRDHQGDETERTEHSLSPQMDELWTPDLQQQQDQEALEETEASVSTGQVDDNVSLNSSPQVAVAPTVDPAIVDPVSEDLPVTDGAEDVTATQHAVDLEASNRSPGVAVIPDEDLAVADLVNEDRSISSIVLAEDFDEEAQKRRRVENEWKNRSLLFAWLVVLLVGALFVGLLVKPGDDIVELLVSNETMTPSASLSMAPTSLSQVVTNLFPNHTRQAIAESSSSPQAKALQWMLDDPSLILYPDWRVMQRFVLATLYYSSGGEYWHNNRGWMTYEHECSWPNFNHSIGLIATRDRATGEITGYEFKAPEAPCLWDGTRSNESKTTIISEQSEKIHHLWIADNNLVGTIPEELWLLTSLRGLALHGNRGLGSTISSSIGKLTDLEGLALDFTNQEEETQMPLEIPSEIGLCTNLRFAMNTNANLRGELPTEMGNMKALELLFIGENGNVGASLPSELGRLEHLRWFHAPRSGLHGNLPSQLGLLTALTDMELGNNDFHGPIPSQLAGLSSLAYFSIALNSLTGSIPKELGLLSELRWLNLRNNQLSGHLPSELGLLSNVLMFSVRNNQLSGSIPTDYGNLGKDHGMQRFSVNNNALTGVIPSELGRIPSVDYLHFQDNLLSGALPSELGLIKVTREFNVSATRVTGTIPSDLCYLGTSNCTYMLYHWFHQAMQEMDCVLDFECSEELLCGCNCNCN